MKNSGSQYPALTKMPNIGETLAHKLETVGINTPEDLINAGSEQAIVRIATLDNSGACINMLYALEGAIRGIRWHGLSAERQNELKEYYRMLNK